MLSSFGSYKIFASKVDLLQRCSGLDTHFLIIVSLKRVTLLSKPVHKTKYRNKLSYENNMVTSTMYGIYKYELMIPLMFSIKLI